MIFAAVLARTIRGNDAAVVASTIHRNDAADKKNSIHMHYLYNRAGNNDVHQYS